MDDPTHILIWIFIFGLMVVLGSLLCLVARQWRRMGETRRREGGFFGTSVGRSRMSARTLSNRESVLELWDSSRLGHGAVRGGRFFDPCWQVAALESSPTSSSADSLVEQLPGRTNSSLPEAPVVRPGPLRLLSSPMSSPGPVLGVVRILGSPTTLLVASTGRSPRRHVTLPSRSTVPAGWSDRLGEIDVWCPAMPFGQLLSQATPPPHATARSIADGAAASTPHGSGRGSRSAAVATATGQRASTRETSASDEEPGFGGPAAAAASQDTSAAAASGAPAGGSPAARVASEEEATAAETAARRELAASEQPEAAVDVGSVGSSSSRSRLPWAPTLVKFDPQQAGQQEQGGAAETSLEPSGSGCAICIEDFVYSSIVRALPCGHVFHRICLDSWFERSSVCPLCLHDYQQAWRRSDGSASDSFFPPAGSLVLLSFRPLAPGGGAATAGVGRGSARSIFFPSQSSRGSTVSVIRNSVSTGERSTASSSSYPLVADPPIVTYCRRADSYQSSRGHRASRNASRVTGGSLSAHPPVTRQRLGSLSPATAPLLSSSLLPVTSTAAPRPPVSRRSEAATPVAGAAGLAADIGGSASDTVGAAADIAGCSAGTTATGAAASPAAAAASVAPVSAPATSSATAGTDFACAAVGTGAAPTAG